MFNEEVLTEKLRYLISTEAQRFEIKDFSIDFIFDSWTKKEILTEYDVNINFDYTGALDSDSEIIGGDIRKMCEELGQVVGTYGIDKNGKLNSRGEHLVYPAMIWNIKFEADTTHIFEVSYKVVVDNGR